MTAPSVPCYRDDLIATLASLYGCDPRLFRPLSDTDLQVAFEAATKGET